MYKLKLFFVQSIVFTTILAVSKSAYNEKGKGNTINFEKRSRRNIQINKILPRNESNEKQSNNNSEISLSTVIALNSLLHPINIHSPEYELKRQQITLTRNTRSTSADQQVVKSDDNLGHVTSLDKEFNKVELDKSSSTHDNINKNGIASQNKFRLKKDNHTKQMPPQKQNRYLQKNKSAQFSFEKALNQQNFNPYIPSTFQTNDYPYLPLPGQVYPYLPGQENFDRAYNLSSGKKFHKEFDKKFDKKYDKKF
ncbi:uncharacterized protein [Rhodnius prolixus]|uniref:uncharacterized protein n=1 Tax=Rhodnius prolixus TaxID=13249 RepID=UPI003D188047